MGHGAVVPVQAVIIGEHGALAAVLLQALLAGIAVPAGIHEAAHAHDVAGLEARDRATDLRDPADDFVARDHGVAAAAPFVADAVDVRVADAAIQHVHGHVVGPRIAAREGVGRQRRRGGDRAA